MAVSPVNITRVSSSMQTLSLLSSLQRNQLQLFLQQNQLSSGLRINAPSDDPVGAIQALNATQALERQDQVLKNIRHANGFMSTTDGTIGEISTLLIEAHGIASEMANSTATEDQRSAQAELIRGMINQLVTLGNRTYEGVYLFGGQQTTKQPFSQTSGGVEYRGDTKQLLTHVGVGLNERFNLDGAELFGALSSQVQGYVDLDPVLTLDTRLKDVNGAVGLGVTKGMVRVTLDSPEVSFLADLTKADTVGDAIDYLHAAAEAAGLTSGPGGQFEVTLNADEDGLDISVAGGDVTIADVGSGTTARDLGILGSDTGTLEGADMQARVTGETTIDALFAGAGATLGSIRIQNGGNVKDIDLSGADTIQKVLNRINSANIDVKASINAAGTGINVINLRSGYEMHIGEVNGDTAETLGIRTLHGGLSLSTLNNGSALSTVAGKPDLRIIPKNSGDTVPATVVEVNLDGVKTVQGVLDAINNAATAAGVDITASLASVGTGIRIEDNTGGGGLLQVERMNGSFAIDALGLNKAADTATATELTSDLIGGIEPDSVFSALIQLENALRTPGGDQEQRITAAGERVNAFIDRANKVAGTVGTRARALNERLIFTEDAVLATRQVLSEVRDLDYTEAITKFQQAETTLQASLLTGSRLQQLSLLNFI